jgi:hypothetical protein
MIHALMMKLVKSFYQYMIERDTTKFNPQNFVETQSKKITKSD